MSGASDTTNKRRGDMKYDEAMKEIAAAQAEWRRVNLSEANLTGADLSNADLFGAYGCNQPTEG